MLIDYREDIIFPQSFMDKSKILLEHIFVFYRYFINQRTYFENNPKEYAFESSLKMGVRGRKAFF